MSIVSQPHSTNGQFRLCGHPKTHKHGKMPNGRQRYFCPHCKQTFAESFDTLDYYRYTSPEQIDQVLQAHSEDSSLRGISRISWHTTRWSVSSAHRVLEPCWYTTTQSKR